MWQEKATGYSVRSDAGEGWVAYREACVVGVLAACGLARPGLPPSPLRQYEVPGHTWPNPMPAHHALIGEG